MTFSHDNETPPRANARGSLTTKSMKVLPVAKYTRPEIEALCKRMETRAASVVLKDQPELVGDIKAASLLLRLLLALTEIETLERHTLAFGRLGPDRCRANCM